MKKEDYNESVDDLLQDGAGDNSITPEELAVLHKNAAELGFVKVSINNAALLAIHDTPVEILPAKAGVVYIPRNWLIRYNAGSTPFAGGEGNWQFKLGATAYGVAGSQLASPTIVQQMHFFNFSNQTTVTGFENLPLTLTTQTENPEGGDGTIDVYVTYDEITL